MVVHPSPPSVSRSLFILQNGNHPQYNNSSFPAPPPPPGAFQIFFFFNFQKFYYYVSWSGFFCGVGEVILAAWFWRFLSLDKFRKFSAILSSSSFLPPASFSSTSKTVYRNVSCFVAVPQVPGTLFYFQSPPSGVQSR